MTLRAIQILLEMWEWFRFLFCMCFVEAFISLSVSLLKFLFFTFLLKGSKNTWLWQVNESRNPRIVWLLMGSGTSDLLNPYALPGWTLHGGSDLFNQISKMVIILFASSTPTLLLQVQLYLALFHWLPSLKVQGAFSTSDVPCVHGSDHWFSASWLVPVYAVAQLCTTVS